MAAIEDVIWWHRIEVSPGVFTPGKVDPRSWLDEIALPSDLMGKSVLDIGCSDGFFAFECEKRGAELVVAVDLFPYEGSGFQVASEMLGSRVAYAQCSVYDVGRAYVGPFDLVLFLGTLNTHMRVG